MRGGEVGGEWWVVFTNCCDTMLVDNKHQLIYSIWAVDQRRLQTEQQTKRTSSENRIDWVRSPWRKSNPWIWFLAFGGSKLRPDASRRQQITREGRCSSPQGAGPPRPPSTHHLPEPIRRLVTSHLKAITTDKKSINPARLASPANTHRDRVRVCLQQDDTLWFKVSLST